MKRDGVIDPARRQRKTPSVLEQRTESLPLQFKLIDATLRETVKGQGMASIGGKQFATEFRGLIAHARKRMEAAKLSVTGGVTRILEQTKAFEEMATDLHADADAMEAELRDPNSNGPEGGQNQPGVAKVAGKTE